MGRRWYLKFDDGEELELDARLWPINTQIPLKDVLAYEREFGESPAIFLKPFDDLLEVPTSFWLFFCWRELQRQQPRLAGRDWVGFCERLADWRDLTTFDEQEAQETGEGEAPVDPPGATLRAS